MRPTSTRSPGYKNAFEALLLPTNNAIVTRFIRLFDDKEFAARSSAFRQKHLDWLASEIQRVTNSDRYLFARSPRAPAWGTARSTIITRSAILDIIGEGDGAFFIKGGDIAKTVKDRTVDYFNSAVEKPNLPQTYSKRTVKQLSKR